MPVYHLEKMVDGSKQRGPFDPRDLDRGGVFNLDRFFVRLREKHAAWNRLNPVGPTREKG